MKGRLQLLRTYPEVAVALSWVVVSRATLWLIGLVSREVLQPFLPQQEPGAPFTENPFLAVCGTGIRAGTWTLPDAATRRNGCPIQAKRITPSSPCTRCS